MIDRCTYCGRAVCWWRKFWVEFSAGWAVYICDRCHKKHPEAR